MSYWIIFDQRSCMISTHLWDRFGHRITSLFTQLLRRMLESGLVDIYRRRTLRRMKLADADHRHHHAAAAAAPLPHRREDETPVKPIVLENLLAVFALYSATTAVAVVAFLFERAAGRRRTTVMGGTNE